MKTRIIKRSDPCSCGCNGRDPWHRRAYKRILRDAHPAMGRVYITDGFTIDIQAEALARMPWGPTRVVQHARNGLWYIDRDSMLDAMNGRS
jgi:hypothetical protein